jgi:ABC-2 type transport system permease protein
MNIPESKLSHKLRIILTIAAKDVTDALKNKTTLAGILVVFLTMLAYKWFPVFVKQFDPFLVIFDAGNSHLVTELEKSPNFNPLKSTSMHAFEGLMDDLDVSELGIVIPTDFNQVIDAGGQPILDGYVIWSNRTAVEQLIPYYEQQFTELMGYPVGIAHKGTLLPHSETLGAIHMTSSIIVITIFLIGTTTLPHLMFEEKQARTLDVLMVSPASINQVVIGKALAGLFYCLVTGGVALAFNWTFITNWGLAILAVISGALFPIGLGLMLGVFLDNRQQMVIWSFVPSIAFIIPTFLSGFDRYLPDFLRTLLPWIPTVAQAHLFRASFSTGAGSSEIIFSLFVVLGGALLVLSLVAWRVGRMDR